jgi:hypothetical protein
MSSAITGNIFSNDIINETKEMTKTPDQQIPLFKSQSRHFQPEEETTFHNTVNVDSVEAERWKKLTVSQNGKVLECFANHAHVEFTAWEIQDMTRLFITDCRRAINRLVKSGWVEQVGEKRERKGALNFTYRYVNKKIV